MIATLLNFAATCFFVNELLRLHRHWKARNDMVSTSLEGLFLHMIGTSTVAVVGVFTGAWLAVGMESFSTCLAALGIYWKIRWLIHNRNELQFWHWRDVKR